jgi:cytochrome c biogenesis protein
MSVADSTPRPTSATGGKVLLQFLGSMNLAVTLLVGIAIASIIGTVLQQNEPYQNYIIKFGPFWFEMFRALGLYDLYGAVWFQGILGFLLVSISVCVYRNGPTMLRDMTHFREHVTDTSLRAFHNCREWRLPQPAAAVLETAATVFTARGFRLRKTTEHGRSTLVAMKGGINRLGYLFTHIAIVIICVGALVDGNLSLKLAEMSGRVKIETRDIPASKVPAISVLPQDTGAFRGSITIPEGSTADFVFLNVRDGYFVQKLPFTVKLKDFRIQHYVSGQPKSFESDLVIEDPQRDAPLEATIAVNHPLIYRGYAIYQASFGDGGSLLKFRAWPLVGAEPDTVDLEGRVNSDKVLEVFGEPLTLELTDFKLFNIFPVPEGDPSGKKFRNHGPSFQYKLRDQGGQAHEYITYMSPVLQNGRQYYISGVRGSPADDFRYLHIPADDKISLERFFRLRNALYDTARVDEVARATAAQMFRALASPDPQMQDKLYQSITQVVRIFAEQGYDGIGAFVAAQVPAERQETVLTAYGRMLQSVLAQLYVGVLRAEGSDLQQGVDARASQFYEDAIAAMSQLGEYAAPFYLQLTGFEQVEASGLQIARAPGKNVVYLGCVLLIAGVFLMFYTRHRRYWFRIVAADAGSSEVLFAGSGHRDLREFHKEYEDISAHLEHCLQHGEPADG